MKRGQASSSKGQEVKKNDARFTHNLVVWVSVGFSVCENLIREMVKPGLDNSIPVAVEIPETDKHSNHVT